MTLYVTINVTRKLNIWNFSYSTVTTCDRNEQSLSWDLRSTRILGFCLRFWDISKNLSAGNIAHILLRRGTQGFHLRLWIKTILLHPDLDLTP